MVSHADSIRRSAFEAPLRDPFARVLALDERAQRRFVWSLVFTLALYGAFGAHGLRTSTGLHGFATSVLQALTRTRRLEYELETPPPPPPPPPEPEPPPEAAHEPPKAAPAAPATPPAAAQAGKVLTAEPDPDEPVDLTGQGFVQGTSDAYAGGVTTADGTSRTAVRALQAAGAGSGVPAARAAPAAGRADLSKAAAPLSRSWEHCGFPAEADIEQIDNARVSIAVTIGADGHAQSASVLQDPGYGFGALAKRCALAERFSPALNKEGAAVASTQLITINFRR
jgi:protein TonB